jgi:WD40 repeat protein
MTPDDDFDRQIQAYLESGPAELADRVLVAAHAQLKTTRRRRTGFARLAPWRNPNMTQNARLMLVGGGALVAVIGVGLFGSIFARPDPGPAATAAPSAPGVVASPSAPGLTPEPSASSSSVAPDSSPSVLARAPGWSVTGEMTEARSGHTATLLPDGRVLVTGGRIGSNEGPSANTAELYDPGSGTWTATGSMHGARDGHTATLLQDGRVLVAGGSDGEGGIEDPLGTAELYDPSTGTWTTTGDMLAYGGPHTATLLGDGHVLVVGSTYGDPRAAELYDPSTGTWTLTGRLDTPRSDLTATLLPDGRVLVAGSPPNGRDFGMPTAELYDPSTGKWRVTGNMGRIRVGHTATPLSDGTVLVAGGNSHGGSKTTASAEVYDPSSGSWTAVGKMVATRFGGWTATLLTDGKVLAVGGFNSRYGARASAELYDPGMRTWTATASLGSARAGQTATLLPDGQVLVAGGSNETGVLASAELYDPGSGN